MIALMIVLLYRYTTLSGFMATVLTVCLCSFPSSLIVLIILMILPKDVFFNEGERK